MNPMKVLVEFFSDGITLETQFDHTERAREFILKNSGQADKVEYHLKKIPLIPSLDSSLFDSVDIFSIKKFLINYQAVFSSLTDEMRQTMNIYFDSEKLHSFFMKGGSDETFYIADNYSAPLATVRGEIKKLDNELKELKEKRTLLIKTRFGYDFRFKDFIVMEESSELQIDKNFFYIEPYDSRNVVIKPVMTDSYFKLHIEKEKLLRKEKEFEKEVLADISLKISNEKKNINNYIASIENLDIFMAKARLSLKFRMNRPEIKKADGTISISSGRYIPQEVKCVGIQTTYFPLTAEFDKRVIVIHGSNMGGKTVLQRSLGFFQLLAQMGFFVPASKFSTTLFDRIFYIGESRFDIAKGLSSFGIEIHNFMESYKNSDGTTLYLIDEFARTTNSHEAVALISAILREFSENSNVYCFLTTHFMGLPTLQNISFYKMKGLNTKEYEKYYRKAHLNDLVERIRVINSFMEYEVVPDSERSPAYDALKIADILGLDKKTIKYAYEYLGGKDGK